jgi:uncharacterized hydrophobic protein (TIGR00271 family)
MTTTAMAETDVQRIERTLFFEPPEMRGRLTRFVMLILFASVIATGGLLSDSVASVIGAMIVAPLMTPIMGMVVAVVIGSSSRLGRSALIVLTGIALAIGVGWLMAILMPFGWEPTQSGQVMARTSPKLLDLVVALASGGAGAYALSRVDVADALPGVAIAISLVPPLNTAGILLAGGEWDLARGRSCSSSPTWARSSWREPSPSCSPGSPPLAGGRRKSGTPSSRSSPSLP